MLSDIREVMKVNEYLCMYVRMYLRTHNKSFIPLKLAETRDTSTQIFYVLYKVLLTTVLMQIQNLQTPVYSIAIYVHM